jgi:serine/threonine protein kinase
MVRAPLPVALGEILSGRYRIESVLGRGGMGVVLAATHIRLGQLVAIKFLLEDHGADPEMRERFEREARATSRIRSEHVARVLDVGMMDSGVLYTVMEYLEGEDLASTLRRRGPFPVAEAVGYVLQACEALAEAHGGGIVHRDLKPANVFLARRADGSVSVKLLDFGISKIAIQGGDGGTITGGATTLGSPRYMPPEQIRSSRDVDARGDLWSLGATLFELLSGQPAFHAPTLPELCVRILEEPAPDLESLVPSAPPGLGAVLRRCLAKQPASRFATVAELAAALQPFAPAEGQLSVERVSRIQALAERSELSPAPLAVQVPDVHHFQDATTMTTSQGIGRMEAAGPSLPWSQRRPGTIRATAALAALLAVVAGGFAIVRKGASLRASMVVNAPPPALESEAAAAGAPTEASLDRRLPSSAVSGFGTPSPFMSDALRAAPGSQHRRRSKLAGTPSASVVSRAKQPTMPPSQAPSPSLLDTEGFGDRR